MHVDRCPRCDYFLHPEQLPVTGQWIVFNHEGREKRGLVGTIQIKKVMVVVEKLGVVWIDYEDIIRLENVK